MCTCRPRTVETTPPYCVRQVVRRCRMGQEKGSSVGQPFLLSPHVKIVNSVAPPKYNGGGHGPSHSVLYICILCLVFDVQMYIVPGPGILCVNMYIFCSMVLRLWTGDPMFPFYCTQNWVFYLLRLQPAKKQDRVSSGGAHGRCTYL